MMENTIKKKKIVVGMSGASGAILGINLLRILKERPDYESHLVISKGAEETIYQETKYKVSDVMDLADCIYDIKNIGGKIASGTFRTEGMIIIPCSMKTVAGIATGYSDNLLLRAADVTLKEGRTLVVVPRETPLSSIHLRNMLTLSQAGAILIPPMITYYNDPYSVDDMNTHIIGKVLEKFHIELDGFKRWGEDVW